MKRILLSLMTIALVAGVGIAATRAFFSDVETSTGNTFTAGTLVLSIDSTQHYNGNVCTGGVWTGTNLYPVPGTPCTGTWPLGSLTDKKFFDFADIKPGDSGENTISLHVVNNDYWACVDISPLTVNDASGNALADGLNFFAWADDGDNAYETGELPLFTNGVGKASDVLNGKIYTLADGGTGNPLPGGPLSETNKTKYIGLAWCAGTLTPNLNNPFGCDGSSLGNDAQGGSISADISFRVEQARNNPNFRCVAQ